MKKVIAFLSSRRAKRGVFALLITVVFTAAVVVLNFGASALQNAVPAFSADMTSNNVFRLSDETEDFIDALEDDIIITVLVDEEELIANGAYFNQANSIARQFAARSSKITLRYIDYEDDKTLENKYPDVTFSTSSLFLVESSLRYCVLDVTDVFEVSVDYTTYSSYITSSKAEQALVTGILAVTAEQLSKAVFISGLSDEDYTPMYNLLKENAYDLEEVTVSIDDIPADADLAVLYAPAADLDESIIEKLRVFLDNNGEGGKTLIYISGYEDTELDNTNALLEEYGLALMDGVMYETDSSMIAYEDNPYMSIVSYGEEIFYTNLKNQSIPFVSPYTRALEVLNDSATVMLYSSTQSAVFPFDADDSFDVLGAVTGSPVVAAAIGVKDNSNIVVFGSADAFASSVMSSTAFNNSAYFATVCNTLADRGESFDIVIDSKTMAAGSLTIKYASTASVITVVFRWILPALMLALAAAVFIRMRRR